MEYREAREATFDEMVEEKLAQYREVRCEAWRAWELSKETSVRTVEEFTPSPALEPEEAESGKGMKKRTKVEAELQSELRKIKRIVTEEGGRPSDRYLNIIILCLNAERELLGLDESKKLEVTTTQIDWDTLLGQVREESMMKHQSIQDEINSVGKRDAVEPDKIIIQSEPNPDQ